MTWVDWVIVVVLAVAMLGGLAQGFLRSACSLAGLFLGLALAAWNYGTWRRPAEAVGSQSKRSPTSLDSC